jgi:hypothetical protein
MGVNVSAKDPCDPALGFDQHRIAAPIFMSRGHCEFRGGEPVVDDRQNFRSRREPTRKGSTRLDGRGSLNRQTLPIKN